MAIIEPSARRILSFNAAFTALLGIEGFELPTLDVLSLAAPVNRQFAEDILVWVSSGAIESCRFRAQLCHPGDGSTVPVVAWIGPADTCRSTDRAVVVVLPEDRIEEAGFVPLQPLDSPLVIATVDHDWRFTDVSTDAAELFAPDLVRHRSPLLAVVHHDDAPNLLLAISRSMLMRRSASVRLRMPSERGDWRVVRCDIGTLCGHNPPRLALSIRPAAPPSGPDGQGERVTELEEVLRDIVLQARSAGILPEVEPDDRPRIRVDGETVGQLKRREVELLELAAAGLSNRAIAERLTLSLNTVRTQFQRLLTKLGAHSKLEAVAKARQAGFL